MKRLFAKLGGWLNAAIQDPDGSPSSSRLCGVGCYLTAFGVAAWACHTGHEQYQTIGVLCAGGAAALFARRKSEGGADANQ